MSDLLLARRARIRWIVVSAGLVGVGFGGYLGFVAFVENGGLGGLGAGVVGLAVATGFAAFFSPCSFPLLVTFLVRRHEGGSRRMVVQSSLTVGLGAVVFFGLLALTLALAGEGLARVVGFDTLSGRLFRGLLGAFLVGLGLRQAHLIRARLGVFESVAGAAGRTFVNADASGAKGDFLYGFAYVLIGFG